MTSAHVLGVLDLTFLDIKEEADLERGLTERMSSAAELANFGPTDSPKKKKEEIKAIRLANNLIENLGILSGPLAKAGVDCSNILWLDLSFNNIRSVPDAFLTAFPNVTTIYFHANRIAKLSVIKKLSVLSQLKSLSLYGNPVEEHKHYHNFILYHCPSMRHFDMSPVTKTEKQQMEVWSQTFRKKLHPEDD